MIPADADTEKPFDGSRPTVTVCAAHFNVAPHFESFLAALARQTYPCFSLVVTDDCSTDAGSLGRFNRLAERYHERGWKFLKRHRNGGPSAARNTAASEADSDYLVFVDSDNLPRPEMLEVFLKEIQLRRSDVVVCSVRAFSKTDPRGNPRDTLHTYQPSRIFDPVAAIKDNTLGDTNFCIRREVFEALGGFREDEGLRGVEDWDLLLRLELKGYQRSVIERPLLDYRVLPRSLSRRTDPRTKYLSLLDSFLDGAPSHVQELVKRDWLELHFRMRQPAFRWAQRLNELLGSVPGLPVWFRRKVFGDAYPRSSP